MKAHLEIINQLFVLHAKTPAGTDVARCFDRCAQAFKELGYSYYSPLHEAYTETRTDVSATIVGEAQGNYTITQVIKPVILHEDTIVQQGVVIVEAK